MVDNLGTRQHVETQRGRVDQGSSTRSYTRDVGMTKRSVGSFTFAAGASQIQNVNNAAFLVNDPIQVNGSNLNNGFFTVTANDGTNLTVDPPPKNEGPVTVEVRTP